jgi:hypothetical protein
LMSLEALFKNLCLQFLTCSHFLFFDKSISSVTNSLDFPVQSVLH